MSQCQGVIYLFDNPSLDVFPTFCLAMEKRATERSQLKKMREEKKRKEENDRLVNNI